MDTTIEVLVVDDFENMRDIVRNHLNDLGFEKIQDADNGDTALEMLQEGNFDLLVTDWNMPGMSGIELVNSIRADEKLANLSILMVSSEARRDRITAAASAGVDAYIVKPFSEETFRSHLEIALDRS